MSDDNNEIETDVIVIVIALAGLFAFMWWLSVQLEPWEYVGGAGY